MGRPEDNVTKMLRTNVRQKQYYEARDPHIEKSGAATHVWARARYALQRVRNTVGIEEDVLTMHRDWLGDLSDKKVLDLGCFAGNQLSMYLAQASGSYLGLDLSEQAIGSLNQKLKQAGLYGSDTRAEALDFLSPEFGETGFDVVYAQSVLHHFEHIGAALDVMRDKLVPGGVVVNWDPMQTSFPVWLARMAYRPLQSDRDWEFPFTRQTFLEIQRRFEIEKVQGILGHSKWAVLAAPSGAERASRIAKRLHARDLAGANRLGPNLWRCMQVTMRLRRL